MKTSTPAVQRLLARARGNTKSGRVSKPMVAPDIEQSEALKAKADKAFEAVIRKRVKELGGEHE